MWRHYSLVRNTVEDKNRDLRLKVGHYIEPGSTLLTYHHSLLRWSCPAVRPRWDSGPDCAWPFPTPLLLYFRHHLCQKGWRPLGTLKQANQFFLINKRIDYSFWRFILCLFFIYFLYINISKGNGYEKILFHLKPLYKIKYIYILFLWSPSANFLYSCYHSKKHTIKNSDAHTWRVEN